MYSHDYYEKNKDKYKKSLEKWRKNNKEKFSKIVYDYRKRKAEKLKAEGVKYCWLSDTKRKEILEKNIDNN